MRISSKQISTLTVAAAMLMAGASWAHSAPTSPLSLVKMAPRTLSEGSWRAAEKTATRGAVALNKKRLTFRARKVQLVVQTGPENDMLSYRIEGLRNPILVVPRGAMLNILFVNTDDDMLHDLRFTTQRAPFSMQPDPKQSVGTPPLQHRAKSRYSAEQITLRAAPGTYTYLCTVKGHAKGGMYGTLIAR